MTRQELYNQADTIMSKLNNPAQDITTIMAFMTVEQCGAHVAKWQKKLEEKG